MHPRIPHARLVGMAQYLALLYKSDNSEPGILQKWSFREGESIQKGDSLFTYTQGSEQKTFPAAIEGTFKAFLWKEGEALQPGCMVAVLQVAEADAPDCENRGIGKILTPEEAKGGMSYAEAASIRLPPS